MPTKGRIAAMVPICRADRPASRRMRNANGKKKLFAMYTLRGGVVCLTLRD